MKINPSLTKLLGKMSSKVTSKLHPGLLLFCLLKISISLDTLNETQNLPNGQTLVSSGGIFEFGFINPGRSTNWFVGVWFVVSPETVVWIANPDNPLNQNSSIIIISKGAIVFLDSSQRIFWSSSSVNSSIENTSNHAMQLLDTGNLVIKDQNRGDIIWQSFDYPSNTLLPGQKIGKNLVRGLEWFLSSWRTETDPSRGKYYYKMDTLSSPQNILWNGPQMKFRSGPWDGLRFGGVPEMEVYQTMYSFILVSDVNEVYYSLEAKQGAPLSRLVLKETGVIQRMVWDQTSHTWSEFWSAPKDPCDYYNKCGPFGICNINEAMICSCIQGFSPRSPNQWYMQKISGGCQRKTQLSCNANDNGFFLAKGVKLPDMHSAIADASISVKERRNRCLMNCSCLAYSSSNIRGDGSGCITWSSELLDTRYIHGAQDLYIKIAKSDIAETGSRKGQVAQISIILTSTIIFLLQTSIVSITVWRKKLRQNNLDHSSSLKDTELPIFDLAVVAASTSNFSPANELGQGGFGVVYKGELPSGEEIAVKRLSKDSSQGLNEFMNEIMLIAKLQHRNLVRLLGCCIHGSERMLIYEFMPNKSLDFFIFDKVRRTMINWKTRLEIIVGVARGLLYLHQDSRFNIIHRDLKAANILLDREMTPKISDFGTARLFRQEQIQIATETIVGTRGYMSPEYAMEGKISVKSDVYSVGVLLLETISGKRNYGNHLLAYAWKFWAEGNPVHLADEAITDSSTSVASDIVRLVHVGLLCLQECPNDRPTMSEIVLMLSSEAANLPDPKRPVLCIKITNDLAITDDLPLSTHQYNSINELTVTMIEGR